MSEESTTSDLAELNRRFVQAWNRRDVDVLMSSFAPDAVWEATGVAEHLRGLTAIRGHLEDNLRPYEEYQVRLEEFLDLGNGVSLSVTPHRGRLVGGSGVVQMRIGAVVLREGGLIMRVRTSIDLDKARADAERLAEERGQQMPEEFTTPDLTVLMRRSALPLTVRDYDAAMRFWAPDGVFDLSGTALGTYEGHAAIRAFFEEWFSAYDDIQFEFEEVHDLGNGVVFAVPVLNARLAGSPGSVQGRYGAVSIWVDGLVERVTNYADIDEARAAAERLAQERG